AVSVPVRSTPSGTVVGNQPQGARGTIVGGPQSDSFGGIWWQIDYDASPIDGWSQSVSGFSTFLAPLHACRLAAGICDVPEACDGVTNDCPADVLQTSSTVCRAAVGACDTPELCTGNSVGCPADVFEPTSTVCRASAGVCDVAEHCPGTGTICPPDI